jgi:GTP-binding protein
MGLFERATFVTGAHELSQLPRASVAEVAFAGRSNAGKSSAINALLNRKRLAFVSRAPGRTRQVNFFDLGDERYLVDLPGYGYANVSKSEQACWEVMLPNYLCGRQALCGLVLIMDIRHPLTARDFLLLKLFAPTAKPVHILLTKADKLTRGAARTTLRKVENALTTDCARATCQLFSSTAKVGVEDARVRLESWLRGVEPPQPTRK